METHPRRRLRSLILALVLAVAATNDVVASDFSIFGRHAIDAVPEALAGFEGAEYFRKALYAFGFHKLSLEL